jgi:hypothetical protein
MSKRSGHVPAGGIGSRQHVEKPVRTGQGSTGIRPAHVAQRGVAIDPAAKEPRETMKPAGNTVPFGNEVAASTVCGPGGSRAVMRSGAQGLHGSPVGENKPTPGGLFEGWETKQRPGGK